MQEDFALRPAARHRILLEALPVVVHGDAVFPGQGIVTETLNIAVACRVQHPGGPFASLAPKQQRRLHDSPGSTTPRDAVRERRRQGLRRPDPARQRGRRRSVYFRHAAGVRVPRKVHHDVLIDLVGYRRRGTTKPMSPPTPSPTCPPRSPSTRRSPYHRLASSTPRRPPPRRRRARPRRSGTGMAERHASPRRSAHESPTANRRLPARPLGVARGQDRRLGRAPVALNDELLRIPRASTSTPSLSAAPAPRDTIGPRGIDWAHAEALAFASLLCEGTPVRLTGQDPSAAPSPSATSCCTTTTGQRVSPIQNLPGALAPMELHNSPLYEGACLGFEYGDSIEAPRRS